MNRRQFFKTAVVAGVAAIGPASATPAVTAPLPNWPPSNRKHLIKPFELEEVSIAHLQSAMTAGSLTAVLITRKYLARIKEIDRRGPKLNSVIELNPDALAIAAALDNERKARGPRGPLHGIPVLIKDNIDTHDRLKTTAGSLALMDSLPPRDSTVAERLRAAGAVLLGKTNLSEWANIRSSHSTSGWSGRGGLTLNPYALDRNPSGSSSGSAAAVSANLCVVAVGTETDGSITAPSSYNGLVGIKPTVGLVSRAGIIPIAHSQDTAGPMARTVRDAAILLGCLAAGQDPRDPATTNSRAAADYTVFLAPHGLRGARLGVARKFFGILDEVDRLMEDAIAEMKRQGAIIVDPADLPTHGQFGGDAETDVLLYEFKSDLNNYLAGLGPSAPVRSLKEIIEFNEKNKAREMPFFGQDLFLKAEAKGPLTEKSYLDALAGNQRLTREEGIDAVMAKHELDAIIAPTTGPAQLTDLLWGDRDTGGCTTPAALAGYPHLTVPAGHVMGLPVGLSFFGRAWSEGKLLQLAFAYEQATQARKPPQFLPRIPIAAS
ncbi:MAG: amidase [Verrucomicrobiota bacterium]|jgi:amidase